MEKVWSDWIEWKGGECPIPDAKAGEWALRFPDGEEHIRLSDLTSDVRWRHIGSNGDIVAYRVLIALPERLGPTPEEVEATQLPETPVAGGVMPSVTKVVVGKVGGPELAITGWYDDTIFVAEPAEPFAWLQESPGYPARILLVSDFDPRGRAWEAGVTHRPLFLDTPPAPASEAPREVVLPELPKTQFILAYPGDGDEPPQFTGMPGYHAKVVRAYGKQCAEAVSASEAPTQAGGTLTDEQIAQMANSYLTEIGWFAFEPTDFIVCVRAILAASSTTAGTQPSEGE